MWLDAHKVHAHNKQGGPVGISFPTDLEKYMSAGLSHSIKALNFPRGKRFPLAMIDAMRDAESPRVLYIEDHEDTRELVTLVLEQKSYKVVSSSTIKSGVALAGSEHFDLYLLDSWLPDGSGLDLCRQIRKFDKTTPILFYSAAAYEIDRDQAMQCGAQAYLVKPSPPSELCSLVTWLIESNRRVHVATI